MNYYKSGNDELKEKVDYQENEIKKLESELNEKDVNYKIEAKSNEYFEDIDKLKKIINTNNQRIQELENENEKYFNDCEENRLETEKKMKELNILNDELIEENEKIVKKLDNKEKLINKYESELNKLNYEHEQKVEKIVKELNDKGILLNKLNTVNNEYEKKIRELKNELNNKEISLDEYKKRLNTSSDTYEKEIQELKKELKKIKSILIAIKQIKIKQ